ncbi:hypothetical protein MLD38_036664 [Melastoma candidum]|uniref:Uncharacterized protein n=1 Tax=Melastoma candidum TaxID=119954 RepID=A0ACB9LLD5_9MYRT|nr:hypothetical protein MLD38_036664 [Melastoma candidum]
MVRTRSGRLSGPTTRQTSGKSSSMTKEDPILELTGVPTVPTGEPPAGQSSSSPALSNAIKEKDDDATQGIGENQFLMQGLAEMTEWNQQLKLDSLRHLLLDAVFC